MNNVFLIGLGTGLGSVFRFIIMTLLKGPRFKLPWSKIFIINMIASFLIGLLNNSSQNQLFNSLCVIGFLGGLSTFSTFTNEAFVLIKNNKIKNSIVYITANSIVGLLLVWLGSSINLHF